MAKLQEFDCVIVGQGLAGTTLEWILMGRGMRVLIIDQAEPSTASRVAAGLMTPYTGKRFAKSWQWDLFWPEAIAFYRAIENQLGVNLFRKVPMLRLIQTKQERARVEARINSENNDLKLTINSDIPNATSEHGVAEMTGGQLDVMTYLNASLKQFRSQDCFADIAINPDNDVDLTAAGIVIPKLHAQANKIIFCQGAASASNKWFSNVRFNPAKGQMIDVRFHDQVLPDAVIHSNIWIAPIGKQTHRVGATYEWDDLTSQTTPAAKQWLSEQLDRVVQAPYTIVNQLAAVRPTMHDFRPVIGLHPEHPQLGILNGLGSKGSLMAPTLARLLTEHILDGAPIPTELDVKRWYPSPNEHIS